MAGLRHRLPQGPRGVLGVPPRLGSPDLSHRKKSEACAPPGRLQRDLRHRPDRAARPRTRSRAALHRHIAERGRGIARPGHDDRALSSFAERVLVSRFRSSHHYAAHSFANFGIKGTLEIYDSSAVFGFEVPTQTRGYNDRNFKSTALGAWRIAGTPVLAFNQ